MYLYCRESGAGWQGVFVGRLGRIVAARGRDGAGLMGYLYSPIVLTRRGRHQTLGPLPIPSFIHPDSRQSSGQPDAVLLLRASPQSRQPTVLIWRRVSPEIASNPPLVGYVNEYSYGK